MRSIEGGGPAGGAKPHPRSIKLLLAEDDRIVRITVRDALEEAGYQVTACTDGTTALRALESEPFDVVVTDVRLPGISGIELFRRLRRRQTHAAVILMTAYADTDDAVAVMREGARDYIAKPFEMDELLMRVDRVGREVAFRKQMESCEPAPAPRTIRCASPAGRQLLLRIAAAASSNVSVLITGETGTGKDLCARTIHARSSRANKPFVAVSCAAIPDNLLEAELFGHEKGAFTGADRRRVGRFETAAGGTLFLDEIGELTLASQAKLLRAIETSTFEPLGSSRSVSVDVRIISATNRDLQASVEAGSFRKDFFYRLNVIDIPMPPLRERRPNIPLLVSDFLGEIAARQHRPVAALDPAVVAVLASHDYPGNVRELIHALERAVAMAGEQVIRLEHLPPGLAAGSEGADPPTSSAELEPLSSAVGRFEQQYVRRVLDRVDGHRGRAAAILGISRKSLWQRLRERSG
ncbi:MAG: sigma-54-dependent Fis family transcriptional regulator [Deltaproteobacteria bacterium]|nr:sigma-54-dependent Fis family transcriptional regulator [Deltaproteobacteria bacterium]